MADGKNIAIIGGGWMGIGCLSVLLECGHKVSLYEKNDDIGGTWHPDNCYAGLTLHSPSISIQYPDFPLPKHIDPFKKISSKQVYEYSKEYCSHKKLYEHMHFNCYVQLVNYIKESNKIEIVIKEEKSNTIKKSVFDYVVYTNGYCNRYIPNFNGSENFEGEIIHSFDATEELLKKAMEENKKIVVLGGSKSATDIIFYLSKNSYKSTWLYRKSYYFLRYEPYVIALKKTHLKSLRWQAKINFHKMIMCVGLLLALSKYRLHKLQLWIWRIFKIIDTYGEKHHDMKKFHAGFLDEAQFQEIKKYDRLYSIVGEIDQLFRNTIKLTNDKIIDCDLLICCTGSPPTFSDIEIQNDGKKINLDEVFDIYKTKVIPAIPNLIFTAYSLFVASTLNGIVQGQWISNYIKLSPSTKFLLKHATHFPFPFFTRHYLFNSEDYFFTSVFKLLEPFFTSGEISQDEYAKWALDVFYKQGSIELFKFNKTDGSDYS